MGFFVGLIMMLLQKGGLNKFYKFNFGIFRGNKFDLRTFSHYINKI